MKLSLYSLLIMGFSAMANPEKGTVNVPRMGKINYYQYNASGEKGTVVFLHGGILPGYVWKEPAQELANAGYRTVHFDMIDFGESDRSRRSQHDRNSYQKQLRAVLKKLEITTPIHLVGSSMGAGVAAVFAARSPDMVKSLSLAAPVVDVTKNHWLSELNLGGAFERMNWWLVQQIISRSLRKGYYRMPECEGKSVRRRDCEVAENRAAQFREQADEGYIAGFRKRTDSNVFDGFLPVYRKVADSRIPTHVLWGTEDKLVSGEQIESLQAEFKKAEATDSLRLTVIDGADHQIMNTHYRMFVDRVLGNVEKNR